MMKRCVMSKLCPKSQQPQLAVGELLSLFLQGEGFFRKENQTAPTAFFVLEDSEMSIFFILQNLFTLTNIATGETSPVITPFHFYGYSNLSNFYHLITSIS